MSSWGHRSGCQCVVCCTIPRVTAIVRDGSEIPGFVDFAGERLRVLEAELRDEVPKLLCKSDQWKSGQPAPVRAGLGEDRELEDWNSPKSGLRGEGKSRLPSKVKEEVEEEDHNKAPGLSGKAAPVVPPLALDTSSLDTGKEKKEKDSQEVEAAEKKPKKSPSLEKSEGTEKKEKREKKARSKSVKRHTHKKAKKSRSRGRRRSRTRSPKGVEETPIESRRKGEGQASGSRGELPRVPRPPSHSPPGRFQGGRRDNRSSGWRGPVPYSNHPRWGGWGTKNKGITKRAKQELWGRRRRDR